MRNLGKRVSLIHKLAQLAGSKELLNSCEHRLGIDEVMRHCLIDLCDRHLFLYRSLHADEAYPELVFEQLANTPYPTVAEMVDIIHISLACPEVEEVTHYLYNVLIGHDPDIKLRVEFKLLIDLK